MTRARTAFTRLIQRAEENLSGAARRRLGPRAPRDSRQPEAARTALGERRGVATPVGATPPNAELPSADGSLLHVYLSLGDHLGSTSVVLDKASGEVVERAHYQPYGEIESNFRPDRWGAHREHYRFTGKEEDVEVGLTYFGARYYHARIGRWMSPDPLTVHGLGADLNPYAYVGGNVLGAVDPWGLDTVEPHGEWGSTVEVGKDHYEIVDAAPPAAQAKAEQKGPSTEKGWSRDFFDRAANSTIGRFYQGTLRVPLGKGYYFTPGGVNKNIGIGVAAGAATHVVDPGGVVSTLVEIAHTGSSSSFDLASVAAHGDDPKDLNPIVGGVLLTVVAVADGVKMGTGRGPTTPYKRPNHATTPAQRASVQGKPCVDCGAVTGKQFADHKTPLVQEHYETGGIDKGRMRSVGAVQPHCPTCSAKQGAEMSRYSRRQRRSLGGGGT